MTDLTMTTVQYADKQGLGFSEYTPPGSPRAPREFKSVADDLLFVKKVVAQPRDEFQETLPHPVWSLRVVKVGARRYWCFAVQGRGGPFGPAGTCRFMFAPVDVHPADVWRAGMRQAAADHGGELAAPDRDWVNEHVPEVLRALALEGPAQVRLPGSPADAAGLIEVVLNTLPRRLVAEWAWSTCLLKVPAAKGLAAGWPEEFRTTVPRLADQLDQILKPPPTTEQFSHLPADEFSDLPADEAREARENAYTWLVGQATSGKRDPLIEQEKSTVATAATMGGLLSAISREIRPPGWRDVPKLLESAEGRAKLKNQPTLVRLWTQNDTSAAFHHMFGEPEQWIRMAIFDALVTLQRGRQDNFMGWPTARKPRGQHPGLGPLLREYRPDEAQRAELIRQLQRDSGLFEGDDLLAAHDWLARNARLAPRRAPDLFPGRREVVEAEIGNARDLTPRARDELSRADNPAQWLVELAPHLGWVKSSAAARLVAAPAELADDPLSVDPHLIQELARALTRPIGNVKINSVSWVGNMLLQLGTHPVPLPVRRAAMYAAVSVLIEIGQRKALLDNRKFRNQCLGIGTDDDGVPREVSELFKRWQTDPVPIPGRRFQLLSKLRQLPDKFRRLLGKLWRRKPRRLPDDSSAITPSGPDSRLGVGAWVLMAAGLAALVVVAVFVGQLLSNGGFSFSAQPSASMSTAGTATATPKPTASRSGPSPKDTPGTQVTDDKPRFDLPLPPPERVNLDEAVARFQEQYQQLVPGNRKVIAVQLIGYGDRRSNPGLVNARNLRDPLLNLPILKDLNDKQIEVIDGGIGQDQNVSPGTVRVVVILAP